MSNPPPAPAIRMRSASASRANRGLVCRAVTVIIVRSGAIGCLQFHERERGRHVER